MSCIPAASIAKDHTFVPALLLRLPMGRQFVDSRARQRYRPTAAVKRLELLPFGPNPVLRKMGRSVGRKHVRRRLDSVGVLAWLAAEVNVRTKRGLARAVGNEPQSFSDKAALLGAAALYASNLAVSLRAAQAPSRPRGIDRKWRPRPIGERRGSSILHQYGDR